MKPLAPLLLLSALALGEEKPAPDPLEDGPRKHGYHEWGSAASSRILQPWEKKKLPEEGIEALPLEGLLERILGKRGPQDDRPVLIRFVRPLPGGLQRAPESQEVHSLCLQRKFVGEINLAIGSRCFRRVEVDVTGADPKSSPVVNRENAPLLVALDREGKVAGTLCKGPSQQPILQLMQKAMGEDWPLSVVIDKGKTLLYKLDEGEALGKEADQKRRLQGRPGTSEAIRLKLDGEIRDLRKRRSDLEKAVREREKAVYATPSQGGVRKDGE